MARPLKASSTPDARPPDTRFHLRGQAQNYDDRRADIWHRQPKFDEHNCLLQPQARRSWPDL